MLASAAGLSRSSITNIESGGQAILLHQFLDIAKALNTDPSGILTIATEPDLNPSR
jgi:transcriptional regulator with XRE-family HTH domain